MIYRYDNFRRRNPMKKFLAMMVVLIGISLTNGNCYAISEEDFFSIALEKA